MPTKTSQINAATTIKGLAEGRRDTFMVDPNNLVVVIDASHPLYDERVKLPIEESFIANIMEYGVIHNIIVRRNGELFEVMDGRQRVRGAIEANKRFEKAGSEKRVTVPVTVRRDDDMNSAGLTVSLNEHRAEDTPLVKARKAQRLINLGETEERIAMQFRTNVQGLRNLLAVLETDSSVQRAVESGEMHVTAASKLSKLSRDEQRVAMQQLKESGSGLSKGAIRAKVAAKVESKRTGESEKDIVVPPKRSVIAQVCDAYKAGPSEVSNPPEDVNPLDLAHALLKWSLTGKGAQQVRPGPQGTVTLASFLRDLESKAKQTAKASAKIA